MLGKIMWCYTLQRSLEQRIYDHAPILKSPLGAEVTRKCKNILLSIVQYGMNLLGNWATLSVNRYNLISFCKLPCTIFG